jgi:hypothetical protein
MNVIIQAAAVVGAIGTIGGGVLVAESRYTPTAEFKQHLSQEYASQVTELRSKIRSEPPGDFRAYLCGELERVTLLICDGSPGHPTCRSRDKILADDCGM